VEENSNRHSPGVVRDAIVNYLASKPSGASVQDISAGVCQKIGETPPSSVRSYLRLKTGDLFELHERGHYALKKEGTSNRSFQTTDCDGPSFRFGQALLRQGDCFEWLEHQPEESIHAVVTDPPYGLLEYSDEEQQKLRSGKGGVWRVPPSFDGNKRAPLPRFTTLTNDNKETLETFFFDWAVRLLPVLVPGANVIVASNPLLSHLVS
jgi:hypothetical protein